jgi:hypothetical protein
MWGTTLCVGCSRRLGRDAERSCGHHYPVERDFPRVESSMANPLKSRWGRHYTFRVSPACQCAQSSCLDLAVIFERWFGDEVQRLRIKCSAQDRITIHCMEQLPSIARPSELVHHLTGSRRYARCHLSSSGLARLDSADSAPLATCGIPF